MVQAADALLSAIADRPELSEATSLLRQLIDQEVDREPEDGAGPDVRHRTAPDRRVHRRPRDAPWQEEPPPPLRPL